MSCTCIGGHRRRTYFPGLPEADNSEMARDYRPKNMQIFSHPTQIHKIQVYVTFLALTQDAKFEETVNNARN